MDELKGKVAVIFAGTPYAIRAAMKATSTIPIVGIDLESDPVASGLVKSVARGSNAPKTLVSKRPSANLGPPALFLAADPIAA